MNQVINQKETMRTNDKHLARRLKNSGGLLLAGVGMIASVVTAVAQYPPLTNADGCSDYVGEVCGEVPFPGYCACEAAHTICGCTGEFGTGNDDWEACTVNAAEAYDECLGDYDPE
jgi:hypothetical protein